MKMFFMSIVFAVVVTVVTDILPYPPHDLDD